MTLLIKRIKQFYNRPLTYLDIKIYLHAFYAVSMACEGLAFMGVLLFWIFKGYNTFIVLAIVILAGSLLLTAYLSLLNRMKLDEIISKAIEVREPLQKL